MSLKKVCNGIIKKSQDLFMSLLPTSYMGLQGNYAKHSLDISRSLSLYLTQGKRRIIPIPRKKVLKIQIDANTVHNKHHLCFLLNSQIMVISFWNPREKNKTNQTLIKIVLDQRVLLIGWPLKIQLMGFLPWQKNWSFASALWAIAADPPGMTLVARCLTWNIAHFCSILAQCSYSKFCVSL